MTSSDISISQCSAANTAARMPAHLCRRKMRSMPPSGRSSMVGRVASTIASDIRPMASRPLRWRPCSRTSQGREAVPPSRAATLRPQAAAITAMKAASAGRVDRVGIMARAPGGDEAGKVRRRAGALAGPRGWRLLAALHFGLEDVAGDRIDIQLHALPLRVGGLDLVLVLLALDLAEVGVAGGFELGLHVLEAHPVGLGCGGCGGGRGGRSGSGGCVLGECGGDGSAGADESAGE